MTLIRRSNTLPSLMNDFFGRTWNPSFWDDFHGPEGSLPAVNVRENEQAFHIEVAAPGMKKEDFEVKLDDNHLIISGKAKQEAEEKKDRYARREFNYQTFRRVFTVSDKVIDGSQIAAQYQDGILNVSLPKREVKTVQKHIEIG